MCGIVGIVGKGRINQALFDALTIIQHRGQDGAGMATYEGDQFHLRKSNGLVREAFHTRHMIELPGNIGIGHSSWNNVELKWLVQLLSPSLVRSLETRDALRLPTGNPNRSANVNVVGTPTMDSAPVEEVDEQVTVGFGEEAEHSVKEVSFQRGSHLDTFAIYYDTRKGLEQRGIEVVSPTTKPKPSPFPGDKGCTPPPNWKS